MTLVSFPENVGGRPGLIGAPLFLPAPALRPLVTYRDVISRLDECLVPALMTRGLTLSRDRTACYLLAVVGQPGAGAERADRPTTSFGARSPISAGADGLKRPEKNLHMFQVTIPILSSAHVSPEPSPSHQAARIKTLHAHPVCAADSSSSSGGSPARAHRFG